MSYKCGVCDEPVPVSTQMKRITKYRMVKIAESERLRKEIEKETPVCAECFRKHTELELAERFKNG